MLCPQTPDKQHETYHTRNGVVSSTAARPTGVGAKDEGEKNAYDITLGSRYVQERPAINFVQDVCRQFQPCTSAQTNPTPGLTRTLTLTRTLGGSRSAGAVTRLRHVFCWRFAPKRTSGGRKTRLDQ